MTPFRICCSLHSARSASLSAAANLYTHLYIPSGYKRPNATNPEHLRSPSIKSICLTESASSRIYFGISRSFYYQHFRTASRPTRLKGPLLAASAGGIFVHCYVANPGCSFWRSFTRGYFYVVIQIFIGQYEPDVFFLAKSFRVRYPKRFFDTSA
jgi:hypothetical protein